ncbi:MAG TPA: ABC transporter transmembrane domain-containing protein, partial [Planctomycetota bacterium]|nr:ABC transporter transmembrane domain-containing protein [Planctomycetota bacterium]
MRITDRKAPYDETQPPFSTKSALSFYGTLALRYRRPLAIMAVCLTLYALLAALRIGSIGLILDAISLHRRAETAALVEAEVDESQDGGDLRRARDDRSPIPPDADRDDIDTEDMLRSSEADRGSAIESLEAVWTRVLPDSIPPPSILLQTEEGFRSFLIAFVITLGIASLLLGAGIFLKEYLAVSVITRMSIDTRRALFGHLTEQSVSYFHDRRAGDLTSRVTNDVEIVQNALHHLFQTVVQQPVLVVAGVIVAFWASPLLFLISLPLLIGMTLPVFRAGKRVLKHGRRRQQNLGILTEALQQLFSGIRIVKAFGMERRERAEFQRKNEAFGNAFRKTLQA